jgi:SNF2 family DNA or RNA helicase
MIFWLSATADCEAQHLHKLAWKEFQKALEGIGTLSKQQAAPVKSEAVIRLRQKSSLLKVKDSIELCLELLDNGRQVAISCEFLATMDAMEEVLRKKKISYARVDGRSTKSSNLKEAGRLRYQRGADHPL